MAAPKLGQPGYKGPVHEAVRNADNSIRAGIGNVQSGIEGGVGNVQSGLQGAGHSLFGAQTGIGGFVGGLFGGGSESAASPSSPVPSRAAQGPTSVSQVSTPSASPRPLVVAPTSMSTGANKTGNATKKRRKKQGK